MINLVLELEGNNLSPVLQELSDYGGRNIVIPREISEQVIYRTVRDLLQQSRVNRSISFLSATKNGETRFFQVREICYLESSRNLLCIRTVQGRYEVYGTLRRVEPVIRNLGFVRVHGSFLISLMHIRAYNARSVEMDDGTRINIGRGFLKEFRKAVKGIKAVKMT